MPVYKDKKGKWYVEIEREVSVSANYGDASYEKNVRIEFSEDELRDMIDDIQNAQERDKRQVKAVSK
jgi:hypothetical protein